MRKTIIVEVFFKESSFLTSVTFLLISLTIFKAQDICALYSPIVTAEQNKNTTLWII